MGDEGLLPLQHIPALDLILAITWANWGKPRNPYSGYLIRCQDSNQLDLHLELHKTRHRCENLLCGVGCVATNQPTNQKAN
jgi:hypothetical protein